MRKIISVAPLLFLLVVSFAVADETQPNSQLTNSQRVGNARSFHLRAIEPPGILVPMYVYPKDVHTNGDFNRLIELKRQYVSVPMWVIVNPGSGPGTQVDGNYTKAIDRLKGAGCVVLGYVATGYAKRSGVDVKADIETWRRLYPEVQGMFFDEMIYEDTDAAVLKQLKLTTLARQTGYWPIVANPGTSTPGRYFKADVADVIVIHEASSWPSEETLHGDFFGGYSDFPPHSRSVLLHSTKTIDASKLKIARKYARWFYVTDLPFRENDPAASNPWNSLSKLMPELCEELSKP